jgi:hypothetical protein
LLDLNSDLEIWLTEGFVNEEGPGDGELYYKIRMYNKEQRSSLEAKWTTWLKGNRAANLNGLTKHKGMTEAFDALLDIPGLWQDMQLTKLHKLIGLYTHEVWRLSPRSPPANMRLNRSVSATSATSSESGRAWSAVIREYCGGSTAPRSRP